MLRRHFLGGALVSCLTGGHERTAAAAASAANAAANSPPLPMPLRLPVWIDGRGPLSFIVDTGASRTALAAHCLPELPRSTLREQQLRLQTPAGSVDVPTVAITGLRAGDGADAVQLAARRLPGLPRQALTRADGLLGADAMVGASLVLDFVAGSASLGMHAPQRQALARRGAARAVEVPVQLDGVGRAFLSVDVGDRRVRAMLDTGALRSIASAELLPASADPARRVAEPPTPSNATSASPPALRSATGTLLQADEAMLPAFRLGTRRWPAGPVLRAPLPDAALAAVGEPRGPGEGRETQLLLGLDRLAALEWLVLDYARARLLLSPLRA